MSSSPPVRRRSWLRRLSLAFFATGCAAAWLFASGDQGTTNSRVDFDRTAAAPNLPGVPLSLNEPESGPQLSAVASDSGERAEKAACCVPAGWRGACVGLESAGSSELRAGGEVPRFLRSNGSANAAGART